MFVCLFLLTFENISVSERHNRHCNLQIYNKTNLPDCSNSVLFFSFLTHKPSHPAPFRLGGLWISLRRQNKVSICLYLAALRPVMTTGLRIGKMLNENTPVCWVKWFLNVTLVKWCSYLLNLTCHRCNMIMKTKLNIMSFSALQRQLKKKKKLVITCS